MKDLNPNWKPFELHADDVCGLDAEFSILVWDWDRLSKFFFFSSSSSSLYYFVNF